MQGWKTVIFGLVLAAGVPALNYLGNVDFTSLGLSPTISMIIGGVIIGLRAVTSTPIGTKS